MDEKSNWGIVIFLIVLFAVFWGGGLGGFGNRGWGNGFVNGIGDGIGMGASSYGFQNYKATCDAEKAEIINTARTQYLTEQQAALTRETINAASNVTNTKIDFYAYQGLRDKLQETQQALIEANNKLFVKDQLAPITAQLSTIQCQMLRRPDVTGVGAVCPNSAIINGLGISSLSGLNSCGCNGNVLA